MSWRFVVAIIALLPGQTSLAQSVIELQQKAAKEFRDEMRENFSSGHHSGGSRVDDVFMEGFGRLFGQWLSGVAKQKPEAVWVTDVPACIRDYEVSPKRFSLVGHPLQGQTVMPPHERWIVLYEHNDKQKAVAAACWLATQFPTPQIFEADSGRRYVIVAGTVSARQSSRMLARYKSDGLFPPEATVSRGMEFGDRVWASPDIVATERRNLGR